VPPSPTLPPPTPVSVTQAPTATLPPVTLVDPDALPMPQDTAADEPSDEAEDADFDWRPFIPADPNDHVARIRLAAAASGCGVPWEVLAAIARVESDFGRNMATSTAGAIGYGQFLPSSWDVFGQEGNAYDYRDVLPAIARYLCRHGAARDPRQAIFAYNHADWYVDQVLGLAARYDHALPTGPTQDVLDLAVGRQPTLPLRFAAGRDAQAQTRPRLSELGAVWLPIAFSGRANARTSPWDSSLTMLRGAFSLGDADKPPADTPAADNLVDMANDAWDAGLDLLGGPGAYHRWSLEDVRTYLVSGHPVVALVHARLLPGHAPDEQDVDQPILLLGLIGDRLIYSDPTFNSSLGFGLEISGADLQMAWDQATTPRRAVAFARRPAPPARDLHPSAAELVPTELAATPLATATRASTREPTAEPTSTPTEPPLDDPTPEPVANTAPDVELADTRNAASVVQLAGAIASVGVFGLAALLRRR
jgi:Transglycosylase SLT domain